MCLSPPFFCCFIFQRLVLFADLKIILLKVFRFSDNTSVMTIILANFSILFFFVSVTLREQTIYFSCEIFNVFLFVWIIFFFCKTLAVKVIHILTAWSFYISIISDYFLRMNNAYWQKFIVYNWTHFLILSTG